MFVEYVRLAVSGRLDLVSPLERQKTGKSGQRDRGALSLYCRQGEGRGRDRTFPVDMRSSNLSSTEHFL